MRYIIYDSVHAMKTASARVYNDIMQAQCVADNLNAVLIRKYDVPRYTVIIVK